MSKPANVADCSDLVGSVTALLLREAREETTTVDVGEEAPARRLASGRKDANGSVGAGRGEAGKTGKTLQVRNGRGAGSRGAQDEVESNLVGVQRVRLELRRSDIRTVGSKAQVGVGVGLVANRDAKVLQKPLAPLLRGRIRAVLAHDSERLDDGDRCTLASLVATLLLGNDIASLERIDLDHALEVGGREWGPVLVGGRPKRRVRILCARKVGSRAIRGDESTSETS